MSERFARLWQWIRGLPSRLRRWAADRRNWRELAGYAVWGVTGAVIAVPEIWAAVDSDHVPWPTISGTVGYIEYWHTWVAVVIIGVLVWAVFHAVKYAGGVAGGRRTPGGRITMGTARTTSLRTVLAAVYYVVAVGCVIGASWTVSSVRPHDKHLLGEVLYGSIGLFGVVIPGTVALVWRQDVPFPTLFWTIQKLEDRVRPVAVLFAAGITVLLIHLALYPWPSVIPDLQDLHAKGRQLEHHQKKEREPPAYAP